MSGFAYRGFSGLSQFLKNVRAQVGTHPD